MIRSRHLVVSPVFSGTASRQDFRRRWATIQRSLGFRGEVSDVEILSVCFRLIVKCFGSELCWQVVVFLGVKPQHIFAVCYFFDLLIFCCVLFVVCFLIFVVWVRF